MGIELNTGLTVAFVKKKWTYNLVIYVTSLSNYWFTTGVYNVSESL